MIDHPDIIDFINLLSKHEVEFILIGGYAVIFYTEPRYTKDVDFLIHSSKKNAKKIIDALEEFGVSKNQLKTEMFSEQGRFFKLGRPPWRIDLISSVEGLNFKDALSDAIEKKFEKFSLKIISQKHLIKLKEIAGRDQDLLDLKALKSK